MIEKIPATCFVTRDVATLNKTGRHNRHFLLNYLPYGINRELGHGICDCTAHDVLHFGR